MSRTSDKDKPGFSSPSNSTWGGSLWYIFSVFAIGFPVSVFVTWAIGELFFTDDSRASLPELFLMVLTYFGVGVLLAPGLPVVLIAFLLALHAQSYGNLGRAKFWRRVTWISALVTPVSSLFIYVLINGWQYDGESWDFLFPLLAIGSAVVWTISMLVGLGIRSMIAKLFVVNQVKFPMETPTGN